MTCYKATIKTRDSFWVLHKVSDYKVDNGIVQVIYTKGVVLIPVSEIISVDLTEEVHE